MTRTTAIDALTAAFENRFTEICAPQAGARDAVVTSWPSVPIEVIRAAGFQPVVARRAAAPTPLADTQIEPGIFPSRIRHLLEAALSGSLSNVARIVIPRTSDPDYKCFLYLREFVRIEVTRHALPTTTLFDLLQSETKDAREYDQARTQALLDELGTTSGRPATSGDLRNEIVRTNTARAAARRLLALRHEGRVSGAMALPLLGAFWQMTPDRYATLATEAAESLAAQPRLLGPRLLLAGAPVDSAQIHAAIESHGAIVVAEFSPWGSGVAGDDVRVDAHPVAAIADKYRTDALTARSPADVVRRWIHRMLPDVDGVVVSLPPDDTTFGWDYPALRDMLGSLAIPHTCLFGDQEAALTPAEHDRIDALVAAAMQRQAAQRV